MEPKPNPWIYSPYYWHKKEEEKRAEFSAQTNKRKQSRNSSDLRISAIAGIPLSSPPPLMASPSDPTNPEAAAAIRRKKNGPPIKFLVPLVYAPVLPLIRLTLRKNPVVRDRLFTAVLVGAFAHGFYLVYPFCFSCSSVMQFDSSAMWFWLANVWAVISLCWMP